MACLLLLIALVLLWWFFALLGYGTTKAVLLAASMFGGILLAMTELLSLRPMLTWGWLIVGWGAVDLIVLGACLRLRRRATSASPQAADAWSVQHKLFIAAMVLILAVIAAVAVVAAPNAWDAMTYHMARVFHWADYHSVQHYPTHITRQLHLGPYAEYMMLHLYVLAGSDRLVNLPAWAAMVGTVLAAAYIARELGAGAYGQLWAAVVACTIPTSLLSASLPLNECVLAFWLASFVALGLDLMHPGPQRTDWWTVLGAGICLGLALLTKGTAYLYALPFCLLFSLQYLWRRRLRAVVPLVLLAAAALAMNMGHFARNQALTGDPLGPPQERAPNQPYAYPNEMFTARVLLSNILRNASLQFCTQNEWLCQKIGDAVRYLHRFIGIDPDDPRTTWTGEPYRIVPAAWAASNAGNIAHVLLLTLALITLALHRAPDRGAVLRYTGAIVGGFLFFCLYLRWQPWHARLHLPVLVLGAPIIGLMLERTWKRPWAIALAAFLLAQSVPFLLYNSIHPLVGHASVIRVSRLDEYFRFRPNLLDSYQRAAKAVADRGARSVGLWMGGDDWDYALCLVLRRANPSVHIEHVGVTNYSVRSRLLTGKLVVPDVVVSIKPTGEAVLGPP